MAGTALLNAILANSSELVQQLLEDGEDPSATFSPPLVSLEENGHLASRSRGDTNVKIAQRVTRSSQVPVLFYAVRNCYENYGETSVAAQNYDGHTPRARSALKIVKLLLEHGASPMFPGNHAASNSYLVLTHLEHKCSFETIRVDNKGHSMTAVDLALVLKAHSCGSYPTQGTFLDLIISMLQAAARDAGHAKPKMVSVPASAAALWKKLLLSDTHADVRFVCADGCAGGEGAASVLGAPAALPAHRCVLATASEYFAALFDRWDHSADGTVRTANTTAIMKAVLTHIYTGAVDPKIVDADALALLSVAGEYMLPELEKLAANACIRKLDAKNVKSMLQAAHLHGCAHLKEACCAYVRRHAAKVLTDPAVMSLAAEDPALWAELTKAIGGTSAEFATPAAKRAKK